MGFFLRRKAEKVDYRYNFTTEINITETENIGNSEQLISNPVSFMLLSVQFLSRNCDVEN